MCQFSFSDAEKNLLALQQQIRALKIPVVIVLEGWCGAGKGTMAGELLEGLDPRGYNVYVPERIHEGRGFPPLHPYWVRMPRQGNISLFIGSWYHDLCAKAVHDHQAADWTSVNQMEQMLLCDGVLLLKFFLNVTHSEQKHRLKALEEKKATRHLVTKNDWKQCDHYDQWQAAYNGMISATGTNGAVWHVLRCDDKKACKQQMYEIILSEFERAIEQCRTGGRPWDTRTLPDSPSFPLLSMPLLCDVDPNQSLGADYKALLKERQKKLRKLQYEMYCRGLSMALAFEGWDAAGKGGSIRRLTSAMDPRNFTVVPIASPTAEEKEHHHLWRFWRTLPSAGNTTIYDRSWYGRVMVERLEGYCTQAQWNRAYEEMNLFEKDLTDSGMIVRKFWLQIDPDEQLRRFHERQSTPEKAWKITDEDWRNREKWPQYEEAVNDMLQKTSTPEAPWIIVEANDKHFARIKVLDCVIAAMEEALAR